jgi:hypothetical protein
MEGLSCAPWKIADGPKNPPCARGSRGLLCGDNVSGEIEITVSKIVAHGFLSKDRHNIPHGCLWRAVCIYFATLHIFRSFL